MHFKPGRFYAGEDFGCFSGTPTPELCVPNSLISIFFQSFVLFQNGMRKPKKSFLSFCADSPGNPWYSGYTLPYTPLGLQRTRLPHRGDGAHEAGGARRGALRDAGRGAGAGGAGGAGAHALSASFDALPGSADVQPRPPKCNLRAGFWI